MGVFHTTRWGLVMSTRLETTETLERPRQLGKRKKYPPTYPAENDTYTIRIFPVFFDGGWETYTVLVSEKPRMKFSHETRMPEFRGAKVGWAGGRLEHSVDKTIYLAGCREFLQETGIVLHQSDLQKEQSIHLRQSCPHLQDPGGPMPCHWDILFLKFFETPPRVLENFNPDPLEIDEVLPRVKLTDLPSFSYKGLKLPTGQRRRAGFLFKKPEVEQYLLERGVHFSDIEAVKSL